MMRMGALIFPISFPSFSISLSLMISNNIAQRYSRLAVVADLRAFRGNILEGPSSSQERNGVFFSNFEITLG